MIEHDGNNVPVIGFISDTPFVTKDGEEVNVFKMGYYIVETKQ